MLFDQNYMASNIKEQLSSVLVNIYQNNQSTPYFVCIGTVAKEIDKLGPIAGSMIRDKCAHAQVYGTLLAPIHAKNLRSELPKIRGENSKRIEIAVDASSGTCDDVGKIRLRRGALKPGKALGRNLPPIGDYALTGVVTEFGQIMPVNSIKDNSACVAMIEVMAEIISSAIADSLNR